MGWRGAKRGKMSALGGSRNSVSRAGLRLVEVDPLLLGGDPSRRRQTSSLRCTYKAPDDDFFCWKFQIWYPSLDCAYRNLHRTCAPCADCAQGSRNLERRATDLASRHWFGERAL